VAEPETEVGTDIGPIPVELQRELMETHKLLVLAAESYEDAKETAKTRKEAVEELLHHIRRILTDAASGQGGLPFGSSDGAEGKGR